MRFALALHKLATDYLPPATDSNVSTSPPARPALPPSCTSFPIALSGSVAFLATLYALRFVQAEPIAAALWALCAYALPIVIFELVLLRTYARATTGLDYAASNTINWRRVSAKLVGLYGTFAILAALYWMIPEYHKDFYRPCWEMLRLVAPYLCVAAAPYFAWVDARQREPKDAYYQAGAALLGQWSELDRATLWQYILGWLVKGFFVPLMFVNVVHTVAFVRGAQIEVVFTHFIDTFNFTWELLFLVDTALAAVGYALTLRVLDAHIRSTEPTVSGWAAALICYEPFWTFFYGAFFTYNADEYYWGHWLQDSPALYLIWGVTILLLLLLYMLSHTAFGIRFSNLTHRGIITNGLYRYSKHPAYVAKNALWWLVAVPFVVNHGVADAVRDCLMLGVVNLIYYARARTEERHLSRDPIYVQYALAMNERSLFAPLARVFPALRYRAPPPSTPRGEN